MAKLFKSGTQVDVGRRGVGEVIQEAVEEEEDRPSTGIPGIIQTAQRQRQAAAAPAKSNNEVLGSLLGEVAKSDLFKF